MRAKTFTKALLNRRVVLVSNTAILEQVCIVVKALDAIAGETTFLLPTDPSNYFGPASTLHLTNEHLGLNAQTVLVDENSDLRFLNDAVIIPQTQYLNDHIPEYLLKQIRQEQCLYTPYGYSVRTIEDTISRIAQDARFGGGLIPQTEHYGKLLARDRFSLVGHSMIFEIAQSLRRSQTPSPRPRVGLHLHWTEQYCSLSYSMNLIEQFALQFSEKFGFPLKLLNHPFLHRFGIEVPDTYSAFREVDPLLRLKKLINDGLLVNDGSASLSDSLQTFDLIISDGQSLIAFAAAAGVHMAIPELPTSSPLIRRIESLPNVTQFDPLDHESSMRTLWEIIDSSLSIDTKPTYFHHFHVDPERSPIDVWLHCNT